MDIIRKGMITLMGLYYRPPQSQQGLEEPLCGEVADGVKITGKY